MQREKGIRRQFESANRFIDQSSSKGKLNRFCLKFVIKREARPLGWSEKQKSWKMQKARADSKSRHTTDFRTVFEIMIGRFVSCEIGQTYFTESGVRFGTLERPDFRSFS